MLRPLRRPALLAATTGAFLGLLPATGLAAAPPTITLDPATYSFDAGKVCSFPLKVEETTQGETLRFLPKALHVTGAYKATLTNTSNGKSISVNVPGPTLADKNTGPWLYLLYATDATGPGAFVLKGQITTVRDGDGNITTLTNTGARSDNLCNALL